MHLHSLPLLFDIAEFYGNIGEIDNAIGYLIKLIEIDDNERDAWFLLAHYHHIKDIFELAVDAYEKYMTLNSGNPIAWNNLGFNYSLLEEYKKAIRCYKKAVMLEPDDPETWENLRYAHYGNEDYEKAEYCEKKVKNLKKKNSPALEKKEEKSVRESSKSYYI